jgi:hypothetical protein
MILVFCLSLDCYALTVSNVGYVKSSPAVTDRLFYCRVCQLHSPVRAAHCRKCGHCIPRRDHHCVWTGTCIGRDNHLYFVGFLSLELVVLVIAVYDMILHIIQPKPVLEWFQDNLGSVLLLSVSLFDVILCGFLLTYALKNAISNQTAWEGERREHISYLKDWPIPLNPFDRGIVMNVMEFVLMATMETEWNYPRDPTLADFLHERTETSKILKCDENDLRALV